MIQILFRLARGGVAPLLVVLALAGVAFAQQDPANVYATYGVHNGSHSDQCAYPTCVYQRSKDEPTDPIYPAYWTSNWVMYRVYNKYQDYPPPYAGKPPPELKEGQDYQASTGATYYDSTWSGPSGRGAMEEHYDKYCLPIFAFANNYSCSFISLGTTAYFVTYDDRPSWMPPVCLFSPNNHPPERDFIMHLPYALQDSRRLGMKVQGYSFWVDHATGAPIQVGVSPDQTANGGILFGYAFDSEPTPDRVDKTAPPYRHPQSFYFSGVPKMPDYPEPDAPIVSQNYTDFAMIEPNPTETWAKVAGLDPKSLPYCQLFNPPPAAYAKQGPRALAASARAATIPSWGSIGKH